MFARNSFLLQALTAFVLIGALSGGLQAEKANAQVRMTRRSPMGALCRSAFVPAWGQFYNHKYIKALVVGATESALIYQTAYYWRRTSRYKDIYLKDSTLTRAENFLKYDHNKELRDQHIWFLGLTVFYSMFDAYVDAHLANFKIDLTPSLDETSANLTIWFKLSCNL